MRAFITAKLGASEDEATLLLWVLAAAAAGSLLAIAGIAAIDGYCSWRTGSTMCLGIKSKGGPWYLVSGLAAAPSFLLTWAWRTRDRQRDLDIQERQLDGKLEASVEERVREAARQLFAQVIDTQPRQRDFVVDLMVLISRTANARNGPKEIRHAWERGLRDRAANLHRSLPLDTAPHFATWLQIFDQDVPTASYDELRDGLAGLAKKLGPTRLTLTEEDLDTILKAAKEKARG